jgi:hypothetical protein
MLPHDLRAEAGVTSAGTGPVEARVPRTAAEVEVETVSEIDKCPILPVPETRARLAAQAAGAAVLHAPVATGALPAWGHPEVEVAAGGGGKYAHHHY